MSLVSSPTSQPPPRPSVASLLVHETISEMPSYMSSMITWPVGSWCLDLTPHRGPVFWGLSEGKPTGVLLT